MGFCVHLVTIALVRSGIDVGSHVPAHPKGGGEVRTLSAPTLAKHISMEFICTWGIVMRTGLIDYTQVKKNPNAKA